MKSLFRCVPARVSHRRWICLRLNRAGSLDDDQDHDKTMHSSAFDGVPPLTSALFQRGVTFDESDGF